MNQIHLYRAQWSQNTGQCLNGFEEDGEFLTTPALFVTEKENVYVTARGQEIHVHSWQPDGSGFSDRKKA